MYLCTLIVHVVQAKQTSVLFFFKSQFVQRTCNVINLRFNEAKMFILLAQTCRNDLKIYESPLWSNLDVNGLLKPWLKM